MHHFVSIEKWEVQLIGRLHSVVHVSCWTVILVAKIIDVESDVLGELYSFHVRVAAAHISHGSSLGLTPKKHTSFHALCGDCSM